MRSGERIAVIRRRDGDQCLVSLAHILAALIRHAMFSNDDIDVRPAQRRIARRQPGVRSATRR